MGGVRVILISGRTLEQGTNLENKLSDEYMNATAVCELSERELEKLGLKGDGTERVRVRTSAGEIVVAAKRGEGYPEGVAFIPMGPWANAVVNGNTKGSGMPFFKGIEAEIEPTDDEIPSIYDLMRRYKE
ncbi:tRNA CCA-pyrophosphorylase [Methanosarcinales archaeon]|nr:MAG: tRNA CCA-pyrophosphorylase [Methanosarcinales archaeon]